METRTEKQTKVYILHLSDMRGSTDRYQQAAYSFDKAALEAFVEEQKAPERYRDDQWLRIFKEDSPLKWFNHDSYGPGIVEEWRSAYSLEQFQKHGGVHFVEAVK